MQKFNLSEPRSLFKHKDKLDCSDFHRGLTSTNGSSILAHYRLVNSPLLHWHWIWLEELLALIARIPPGWYPRLQGWALQGIMHALTLGIMEHWESILRETGEKYKCPCYVSMISINFWHQKASFNKFSSCISPAQLLFLQPSHQS